MRQFDVCENANPRTRAMYPYLLNIQADLLRDLATRVVIPLVPSRMLGQLAVERLMPKIAIRGEEFIALTPELAGVSLAALGAVVANVADQRAEILAAIDLLVTGA